MKKIAIKVNNQEDKARKVLKLNGYGVLSKKKDTYYSKNIKVFLSPNPDKGYRYEYFSHLGDDTPLTLKKQGGGDWSKLYELIEKDKGIVNRLDEHEYNLGWTLTLVPGKKTWDKMCNQMSYPQYGKDVDPDKIDAYFDGEDTLKVVTDFLDKVEITDLPEEPKPEWDYPCCGTRDKTGVVIFFTSKGAGVVIIEGGVYELGYESDGFIMNAFTPTNIKEV